MSVPAKIVRKFQAVVQEASLRIPARASSEADIAQNVVLSLTSYPARIGTIWKTLETIYRQSVLPSKIVLVLSAEEFPTRQLPDSVSRFMEMGMEVVYGEGNIRSYKKLVPVMAMYPEKSIVTADDDVLYPRHWLRDLVVAHESRPSHILGHRGTVISGHGHNIEPYVAWHQANTQSASSRVFLTGMGGILYPPHSLPVNPTHDMTLALQLAPTADDIWFKAMSMLAGTAVAKVSDNRGDFATVRAQQTTSLRDINVSEGQNEVQFKAVMDHFDLWGRLGFVAK